MRIKCVCFTGFYVLKFACFVEYVYEVNQNLKMCSYEVFK